MGIDLSAEDKLEQLLNSKIEKQGGSKINAKPMDKNEIIELYYKEDCMCLINFETDEDGKKNNGLGSGYFCILKNIYFPFQKALFTNNHILNKNSIILWEKIKLIYKQKSIIIEMTKKRNRFTNEKLDYTCIEIFDEDKITNFFDIDTSVINNKSSLEDEEIFILQFNETKNLLFSSGKILEIKNNIMVHSAVTSNGSSGSPLIRRNRNELKYIVGIHYGTLKDHKYYNLATSFDNILNDLKNKIIEASQIKIVAHIRIPESHYKARIICSCENAQKDYELKLDNSMIKNEEEIKECLIFINKQKKDFSYYYTFRNPGDYEIIYIFNNLLNSTNLMFYKCKDLTFLDLSNFNTENVINMNGMFNKCSGLRIINLKNLNTEKVTDMGWMFNECSSLRDLDLSSFKTENVQNMGMMFNRCESLTSLNISTFNTENVTSMLFMFWKCRSLKKLDLSNFNTGKVESMQGMFSFCLSLKSLDVSNFNTEKVTNMIEMFFNCKSLENLDLKSFNIRNVKEMLGIFADCEFLVKIDLSNFDTRHLDEINWLFSGCKNLKRNNVITKDERILKTFD